MKMKDKFIKLLIKEGYLKGNKLLKKTKPYHGTCCCCGTCGHEHNECICEHNRLLRLIRKM